jgi:hypothetical protein
MFSGDRLSNTNGDDLLDCDVVWTGHNPEHQHLHRRENLRSHTLIIEPKELIVANLIDSAGQNQCRLIFSYRLRVIDFREYLHYAMFYFSIAV